MSNDVTITAPEGLPFIDIEREFDYPVELVFRAHKESSTSRQEAATGTSTPSEASPTRSTASSTSCATTSSPSRRSNSRGTRTS